MTLILTNDDGIDAPGIRALFKAVNGQCAIVAPKNHLSGCGHQVTTHQPIHVDRRSDFEYAVDGTPADCVRIAITHLYPNVKLVLSGINYGGNMGADAYISGTVAAVREAAMHGIPAIAISQYLKKGLILDWDIAVQRASKVLVELFTRTLLAGSFWNVNLPHLEPEKPEPEIIFCQPSVAPLPVKYRVQGNEFHYIGEYAKRDRSPGTDVDVCFSGNIAVTQLRV